VLASRRRRPRRLFSITRLSVAIRSPLSSPRILAGGLGTAHRKSALVPRPSASGRVGRHSREADSFAATLTDPCQPMPKSRGRKPKKNRAPVTAAPKRQLDTAQQPPPLSTQPPQRQISVLPQAQRSRWLRLTLRALIIVGIIAVLYALFELGRWGALRWSLL
jgi:hypothetical protein